MSIARRFPEPRQILPVAAVICFLIYAWTLFGIFKLLAISWLLFITPGDLVGLIAYQLLTAAIECMTLLGLLLLVSALLPPRRDSARCRGPNRPRGS